MVINIKKRVLAVASAMLALFVFVVFGISNAPTANAASCPGGQISVTILGSGLTVCVPEASLPTVTVTLPTVTRTLTLPRVTLPRATVTDTIRVPGSVVTRNVPGPVKTVTVNNRSVVTSPRQTVTNRATLTGPTAVTTVTATATVTKVGPDRVVITKARAVGISLLLILLGVALGLALLWGAYTYGWLQGDGGNRKFLREVRDELKYRD
jgi:hypothetical protein